MKCFSQAFKLYAAYEYFMITQYGYQTDWILLIFFPLSPFTIFIKKLFFWQFAIEMALPMLPLIWFGCRKLLKLSETINDMSAYTKLNDGVFHMILYSTDEKLKEAREILERVECRKLYKFIGQTKPVQPGTLQVQLNWTAQNFLKFTSNAFLTCRAHEYCTW